VLASVCLSDKRESGKKKDKNLLRKKMRKIEKNVKLERQTRKIIVKNVIESDSMVLINIEKETDVRKRGQIERQV
jgi:hypothetical protein